GCETFSNSDPGTNTPGGTTLPDKISAGDTLTISLILPASALPIGMDPSRATEYKVKSDGNITLYLIKDIKAEGLTPIQLEQAIHDAYVPKMVQWATVSVRFFGQFFYVNGQVQHPFRYDYVGNLTVINAISTAGGFTDYANRKKVQITRP